MSIVLTVLGGGGRYVGVLLNELPRYNMLIHKYALSLDTQNKF